MATKSIAWNDGSGDYITLTYTGRGDGTVTAVSQQNNNASARSKTITITTTAGSPVVTRNLTVRQGACPIPIGTVLNYAYTGSYQEVTLPAGKYKLQVWGAQGGSNAAASSYGITAQAGGKGGYSEGVLTLTSATDVRVYVGGAGSSSAGGFNGGGSTTGSASYSSGDTYGTSRMGGGGGATDIRLSDGALLSRIIVAGGGSGGAMCYKKETTSTTSYSQKFSGSGGEPNTGSSSYTFREASVTLANAGLSVGDTIRIKPTITANAWSGSYAIVYMGQYNGSWLQHSLTFNSYTEFTIPTGATYLAIQSRIYGEYKKTVALSGVTVLENCVIENSGASNDGYYYHNTATGYNCIFYDVSSYRNSKVKIVRGAHNINVAFLKSKPTKSGMPSYATGWSKVVNTPTGDAEYTVPSDASYMYYYAGGTADGTDRTDASLQFTYVPHSFSAVVEKKTTTSSTTTSNESQVGYVGGGTNGGGYNSSYYGKQNGAGSHGSFGQGANQTTTNYRYCSGAGGGGWYGGGGRRHSDSDMNYCKQSGGGSGFVNTAANASYRPSGYTGLELDSGETKAGNTSFPNTAGTGNETGHSGNGYAIITRIS